MSPQNPQVNQPITISATITDPDGTISTAQLLWGTSQNELTNTLDMTANGSTYLATIPQQSSAGIVFFRISATDNNNANSVLNSSIEITGLTGPVIEDVSHTPEHPNQNNAVTVWADVSDPDGNLYEVRLVWGLEPDALSNTVVMEFISGTQHSAVIPAQAANSTVYYRVEAFDADNNSASAPTIATPYQMQAQPTTTHNRK